MLSFQKNRARLWRNQREYSKFRKSNLPNKEGEEFQDVSKEEKCYQNGPIFMKILDRAPMPLSKYALGGKLSQSAWIISLVCQLCQAYKKKKNMQTDRENYMS